MDRPIENHPIDIVKLEGGELMSGANHPLDILNAKKVCALLKDLIDQAVQGRRQKLAERQSEIARMASQWAVGMDDVRVASVDLLTLTLLIPHG